MGVSLQGPRSPTSTIPTKNSLIGSAGPTRTRLLEQGREIGNLTVDRLRKLAMVGFVFRGRPMDVPWEVNFDKLKAYRDEHDGRLPRPIPSWETGSKTNGITTTIKWMGRQSTACRTKVRKSCGMPDSCSGLDRGRGIGCGEGGKETDVGRSAARVCEMEGEARPSLRSDGDGGRGQAVRPLVREAANGLQGVPRCRRRGRRRKQQ